MFTLVILEISSIRVMTSASAHGLIAIRYYNSRNMYTQTLKRSLAALNCCMLR